MGLFYLALLVAFVVALLIAARYAATVGLGHALRLGGGLAPSVAAHATRSRAQDIGPNRRLGMRRRRK